MSVNLQLWYRAPQKCGGAGIHETGQGLITVNDKPVDEFFSRETGRMVVRQPLELTGNLTSFDIVVNIHGGGESGQAGAVRHGITRALIDFDATSQTCIEQCRTGNARRARSGTKEGWVTQGAAA